MTIPTSSERRAARRHRRTQSPFAQIPFGHIQNHFPPTEVITLEQIEQLHEASMHILEEIGITFMMRRRWTSGRRPGPGWITPANMSSLTVV